MRSTLLAVGALSSLLGAMLPAQAWVAFPRPRAGSGGRMVFDAARARSVLFESSMTWAYDGTSWAELSVSAMPGSGPVVYDSTRNRSLHVILDNGPAQTWAWGGVAWTQVVTAAAPGPRRDSALTYDSARDRVVLFGGVDPLGVALADTWQFDGTNWVLAVTAAAPSPRSSHALCYHASIGRSLLHGGKNLNGAPLSDTWTFDGSNWLPVATAVAPSARSDHSLVYASNRGRSVLFGGGALSLPDDTWEFDGATWLPVTTVSAPSGRSGASLVFDSVRNVCLLFGGGSNETWEYDGTDWRPLFPPLPASGFWGPSAEFAFDSRRGRMVLGGPGTWEFDASGWHRVITATAAPTASAMAFDAARAKCVSLASGVTWTYDGVNWAQLATTPSPPSRTGHRLVYDSVRERVVLFGGTNVSNSYLGDTWEFDGTGWVQKVTAIAPPARSLHCLAFDARRGQTVLFGGLDSGSVSQPRGDTWEYDGSVWTPIVAVTSPSPRYLAGMAYDIARGKVVLLGGQGAYSSLGDVWAWDGQQWALNAVSSRGWVYRHAMAYDSVRMRMVTAFGGYWYSVFSGNSFDTLWELPPPIAATWTPYGLGCPGSAGVPLLDRVGTAVPTLGTSFPLQIRSLPPSPGVLYLALGFGIAQWNGVALPQRLGALGMPDCMLWIAPEAGAGPVLLHSGSSITWQLVLPLAPALAGVRLAAQALVLDAAAPGGLGVVSNAGVAILH